MTDVADNLRKARALVAQGWTQDSYARGKSGRKVDSLGKRAVCFCAVGAIRHALRLAWDSCAERDVLRRVVGGDVIDWNDEPGRTQAEVLAAFDKAIEIAEAQQ